MSSKSWAVTGVSALFGLCFLWLNSLDHRTHAGAERVVAQVPAYETQRVTFASAGKYRLFSRTLNTTSRRRWRSSSYGNGYAPDVTLINERTQEKTGLKATLHAGAYTEMGDLLHKTTDLGIVTIREPGTFSMSVFPERGDGTILIQGPLP